MPFVLSVFAYRNWIRTWHWEKASSICVSLQYYNVQEMSWIEQTSESQFSVANGEWSYSTGTGYKLSIIYYLLIEWLISNNSRRRAFARDARANSRRRAFARNVDFCFIVSGSERTFTFRVSSSRITLKLQEHYWIWSKLQLERTQNIVCKC